MSAFRIEEQLSRYEYRGLVIETHTACMTRLKHVQSSSHISFAQPYQATDRIRLYVDLFLLDHNIDQLPNVWLFQGTEPEPRTPGK